MGKSLYEIECTQHTDCILDQVRKETGLNIEVHYWNYQYHVMIDKRHVFCGEEYECRNFMDGMLFMATTIKKQSK